MTTNTVLEVNDGRATAVSDFVFLWLDRTMGGIGRYTDELELLEGRWVFTRREIRLLDDR